MARLHSKKKGKSGTKRPKAKTSPEWIGEDPNEVRQLIVDLAKKGTPESKIGLELRDSHGIPSVKALTGKTMTQILGEEKTLPQFPEDMLSLIKKAVRMRDHLKSKKKDLHNKVKLSHVEAKIGRLVKHYKQVKRIPADWKYDPESAVLLVK